MAFEIRFLDRGPVYGGGDPLICRFTDEEWWNLLSLAHECGFDPNEEFVPVVYPENVGETNELDNKAVSGLYIGVSTILNQDTLPFATTWESNDGRLHFRWAGAPGYARIREIRPPVAVVLHFRWAGAPGYARDREPGVAQTPGTNSDFDLEKASLRRLLGYLGKVSVLVARIEGPGAA
ncbi:hypothetical protein BH24ACT22_BH24ACT22_05880 [soil metagenome]